MIYQFLTYHTDHLGIKLNMSSVRGEKKYTGTNFRNPISLINDEVLSIDSMCDIETFKRLANLSLFPDLMEYYVTHKTEFSKDKHTPSNMFIEAIITSGFTRTIPNIGDTKFKSEITWKLAYNLNEDISDETSDYAQQMKRDFEMIYDLPLRYKEVTFDSYGNEIVT
jgi:hypothetical protein